MEEIAEITGFYLEKFREIEAAAPEDEREMARSMLALRRGAAGMAAVWNRSFTSAE